jgi:SAM-dependent methyltransferase
MGRIAVVNKLRGKTMGQIVAYLRSRLMVSGIIKTIDLGQFKVYQERYKTADPAPGSSKFLDIRPWMMHKLMYYYLLGLDKSRPLQILDIGAGTGYFSYICSLHGHTVVAIDLDTDPMYNAVCQFLHVNRRTWRIVKYERLPDFGIKFDLVTAFMVTFNNRNRPDQWGVGEWQFLIEDLKHNQLTEDGRMFLALNAYRDGTCYDAALLRLFLESGARVSGNQIDIRLNNT